MVLLDRVSGADAGVFKITDVLGFTVSYVHLKVKRKDEDMMVIHISPIFSTMGSVEAVLALCDPHGLNFQWSNNLTLPVILSRLFLCATKTRLALKQAGIPKFFCNIIFPFKNIYNQARYSEREKKLLSTCTASCKQSMKNCYCVPGYNRIPLGGTSSCRFNSKVMWIK